MSTRIRFTQPQGTRITCVLLFSAFITLVQNIAFYRQTFQLLNFSHATTPCFFFSMPLVIFSVLNILFMLFAVPYLRQWAIAALCSGGECYDDALFTGVEEHINQLNNDAIIVLHMIGSHGPAYYKRNPEAFKHFTPTYDTNQIQNCSHEAMINTYDNTILYLDAVLDNTIQMLKRHQDKFNTALVYLSEHGESLGENGVYLHSMPYAMAPSQQTHVPMLMWLSDDYQQQFAVKDSCVRQNAQTQRYSQDNLFHTLLGMFNVGTDAYQPELDILRDCQDHAA